MMKWLAVIARRERVAVAAAGVSAGGALVFASVAHAVSERDTRSFDEAVLNALHPYADRAQAIGPWWLDRVALDLTSLGSTAVLTLIAALVAGFLILRRRWLDTALLLGALGGALLLSEGLKGVFARDRPPAIYRSFEVLNASFPSGHALLSAVLYPTLAAMLAGVLGAPGARVYVLAVGAVLAVIVGATRVYLGAHWATDVVGGWCVGAAWAALCWLAARALRARLIPSPETPIPRG